MGLGRLSFDNEGITTAVSFAQGADDVAQDLARQLISPYLGFVVFFCSAEYDLPALSHALEQSFGGVPLVGCTTAGEISEDGYGRGCISAIGFDHRHFLADVSADGSARRRAGSAHSRQRQSIGAETARAVMGGATAVGHARHTHRSARFALLGLYAADAR